VAEWGIAFGPCQAFHGEEEACWASLLGEAHQAECANLDAEVEGCIAELGPEAPECVELIAIRDACWDELAAGECAELDGAYENCVTELDADDPECQELLQALEGCP